MKEFTEGGLLTTKCKGERVFFADFIFAQGILKGRPREEGTVYTFCAIKPLNKIPGTWACLHSEMTC